MTDGEYEVWWLVKKGVEGGKQNGKSHLQLASSALRN
jgi:hypothetical protein